jgi:superfamily II DNA/RNA helicase
MRRRFSGSSAKTNKKIVQLTSFQDFGLAEPIARAVAEEKYVTPAPIQAQTIPMVLPKQRKAARVLPAFPHRNGR